MFKSIKKLFAKTEYKTKETKLVKETKEALLNKSFKAPRGRIIKKVFWVGASKSEATVRVGVAKINAKTGEETDSFFTNASYFISEITERNLQEI